MCIVSDKTVMIEWKQIHAWQTVKRFIIGDYLFGEIGEFFKIRSP